MAVNWNTHHGVLKDSATSPIKLESHSSFKNGSTAITDLMDEGLNTLHSLIPNIVKFSDFEVHVDPISFKFAETVELRVFNPGVAMLKMAVPIVDNLVNQLA